MKLYTILAFAFAMALVFAMPFVLAENESVVTNEAPVDTVIAPAPDTTTVDAETAAEINDDLNDSVSGLRIGWERAKLAFTFNNEKKAMQELKLARLRLVQARVAAKNGNTIAMENALEAHERIMERVKTRVNAIDGASDNRSARLAAAKLVGLERAIAVHEARISKLGEILASENLTDQQRTVAEQRLAQAQANTEKLKQVQAAKKESIKTKLRAVTNMTEEEVDAAISEIEDAQNLSAVKKLASQVRTERQERVTERAAERVETRARIMENLSDETQNGVGETVRSEVEQRLEAGSEAGSNSGSGKSN